MMFGKGKVLFLKDSLVILQFVELEFDIMNKAITKATLLRTEKKGKGLFYTAMWLKQKQSGKMTFK